MSYQPLRCSAAWIDITPISPVATAGFAERDPHPVFPGDARLEACLLLLESGDTRVLLASFDLLYPGPIARGAVLSGVQNEVDSRSVFTFASHTHYAPATDPEKPGLGEVDPSYERLFRERVSAAAVGLMASQPEPVGVGVGQAPLFAVASRRLRRLRLDRNLRVSRMVKMAPNVKGQRPQFVSICVIKGDDGPVAVIWNYACHPTSYPDPTAITAEFPGAVREDIRRHFDSPELPVMFLQGFSGDLRPPFRSKVRSIKGVAERIMQGPQFGLPTPEEYRAWTENLTKGLDAARRGAAFTSEPQLGVSRLELPVADFVEAHPRREDTVPFGGIRIGPVVIAGVGAEPVSDFGQWVRRLLPDSVVMPAGCMDETYGYTPSADMHGEGGYEVNDHCQWFGYDAIRPGAAAALRRGLNGVLEGL